MNPVHQILHVLSATKAAAEAEPDTVVDVDLPLVALDAAGLGVPDRVDTTGEVQLARSLLVAGDYKQLV